MSAAIPAPVQIRFLKLFEADMAALSTSLVPFGRWSEERIGAELPVTVVFPSEIQERLKILNAYLDRGGWPSDVHQDAMATVRSVVTQMIPAIEQDIVHAVRLMAAAAIRDDGSRAAAVRDTVLSAFLAAKMLATARAIRGNRLENESPPQWGVEFNEMADVRRERLIYGLSYLAREPHRWAGWTDADLWIGDTSYRVFVPICPNPEEAVNCRTLVPAEVQRLIIPQILCSDRFGLFSFSTIRDIVFGYWPTLCHKLMLRSGEFVDAETFSSHREARDFVTRITADRIVSRLRDIPQQERHRELFRLTASLDSVGFDVAARVNENSALG